MSDRVYLEGSDDVRRASRTMMEAAETMSQAASNIDGVLERHQRFLDDWLLRFQNVLERSLKDGSN